MISTGEKRTGKLGGRFPFVYFTTANVQEDIVMRWTKRQATAKDEEFAYGLRRAAYEDVVQRQFGQWNNDWQRQRFTGKWIPEQYEIVEAEGRPIGALHVSRTQDEVEIVEIQLLPEYQGQSIGTELLQQELRFADERGLSVRLQVLRENRARSLYKRLGFHVYDETDTHFLMKRTG